MMKKNICCILLMLSCMCYTAFAQKQLVDTITPMYVGGRLPRSFFDAKSKVLERGMLSEASLAGDFDKLILIDFWASWCGACFKKFPLLEKMQKQFPYDLKVLLVNSVGTGDSAASLAEKVRNGAAAGAVGGIGLPLVVEDKLFLSAFPHRALPHYVWIIGGIVMGITFGDFVTEENVAMMIARKKKYVLTLSKFKKLKGAKD
jgi:thiol-disulfide isomerase/thioredoxin